MSQEFLFLMKDYKCAGNQNKTHRPDDGIWNHVSFQTKKYGLQNDYNHVLPNVLDVISFC